MPLHEHQLWKSTRTGFEMRRGGLSLLTSGNLYDHVFSWNETNEIGNRIAQNFFSCNVYPGYHFFLNFHLLTSLQCRKQCLIVKQTVPSVTHSNKAKRSIILLTQCFAPIFFVSSTAICWFQHRCRCMLEMETRKNCLCSNAATIFNSLILWIVYITWV